MTIAEWGDYQTPERFAAKLAAVPLPASFEGQTVLDIGCDYGAWSKLASDRGAARVVGIDRGRVVRGHGFVDLATRNRAQGWRACEFYHFNVGLNWEPVAGLVFDHVFCFSMYHWAWAHERDHDKLWRWLRRHVAPTGTLWWEGPVSTDDGVVRDIFMSFGGVSSSYQRDAIERAAQAVFVVTPVGKAGHVHTREVWRCTPRVFWDGLITHGAGGATPAFTYADDRRRRELATLTGELPFPGSLNVRLTRAFDWTLPHITGAVLDVVNRRSGLNSPWVHRTARLYPVTVNGHNAWVFRFDGDTYPESFVELIAPIKLRDVLDGLSVMLCPR